MKWIPMSERLPENGKYYLWCSDMGSVQSDYYWDGFDKERKYGYNIVAWMPLPEPYTADRKTEPTGYNLSPVEDEPQTMVYPQVDGITPSVIVKDEPQTDCGDFADRLAYERGVKHAWEVAQKVFDSTLTFYEAEDLAKQIADAPQTDCSWK